MTDVRGSHRALRHLLAWSAVLAGAALLLFLTGVDDTVSRSLCDLRGNGSLSAATQAVTDLGGTVPITGLALVSVAGALALRRLRQAAVLLLVPYLAAATGSWVKDMVAKPRPSYGCTAMVQNGYSFPSSHAISATAGVLLVVVVARISWNTAVARAAVWVGVVVAAAISWSRVLLGVHRVVDVLAGQVWGLLWVAAAVACLRWPRMRSRRSSAGAPAA